MSDADVFIEAELAMRFIDEKVTEVVTRALAPDNDPLPSGLNLEMLRDGNVVIFRILCRRPVRSLLATLDDILSMSILALKCLRSVEG